jgi:Tol biopolymer transport system component
VYDSIDGVQFTPDGLYVIFKADDGTGYKLFRVAVGGGVPVALDAGLFEFSVDPVVSSHLVAYSKDLGAGSEVYTVDYLTSSKVAVTSLGNDVYFPNWSRDGGNIIFGYTAAPLVDNIHLFNATYPGAAVTQVTPATTFNEAFGFYNEDMTKVATIRSGGSGILLSSYLVAGGTYTNVVNNSSLGPICYWTDSNGRGISANIPSFKFGSGPRRRR